MNNTFPLYLNGSLTLPDNTPMLWDVNILFMNGIEIKSEDFRFILGEFNSYFDLCFMWYVYEEVFFRHFLLRILNRIC